MIRTRKPLGIALTSRHLSPTMTTDVIKGPELALFIADDHNRLIRNTQGEVVTRLFKLLHSADAEPIFLEDAFLF